jgi:hypothetical protein
MDDQKPASVPPTLHREVEPPQRQPTGLGVMLLASTSMFFAVAGSALVVRARMAAESNCPYRARIHQVAPSYDQLRPAPPPIVQQNLVAPSETTTADCTVTTTRIGPSGEQLIDFHVCPD